MAEPELISKILSCYAEIEDYSQEIRPELEEKLAAVRSKRKQLVKAALSEGLRVKESNYHHSLDDLFDTDDTGKLVDTTFKVKILSQQEAVKAVDFCRRNRLLAMPIGARTSALGVFDARSFVEREGLKGVLGLEFENIFFDIASQKNQELLITIPHFSESDYELVTAPNCGALALLKSKSFDVDQRHPHRIIAHAGTHILDLNKFVNTFINSDRYSYRIMPDPTSWAEAQIGGIVATGAEGGNRTKASEDLLALQVIDGNANVRNLEREQACNVVGLNGNAGIIFQAEFAVTAFPKHEHGLFVVVSGQGLDAWKGLLQLQNRLKPFCRSAVNNARLQVGAGDAGIIVTSIEPLSRDALILACGDQPGDFEKKLIRAVGANDFAVFVTFNSFYSAEDPEIYESALYKEALQLDLELAETDTDDNFKLSETFCLQSVRLLSIQELQRMDQIRHEAPSHARELAKRMGGVTESTDLNIRFEAESVQENEAAFDRVAQIYHDYTANFTAKDGFRVVVYGHMHPGVGDGGGIDPHVRVIFELSNPGSRYNAPEQAQLLKKKQSQFYRKLLALDGQFGIKILSPEKSRFTNTEYWTWFLLKFPERAAQYLRTIADLGYGDFDGQKIAVIGARVPHILPNIFPLPSGVKSLLNPDFVDPELAGLETGGNVFKFSPSLRPYLRAVLELSQSSHRGGRIRRLVRYVLETLAQRLALSDRQYVLMLEDPEEARAVLSRNGLGADYALVTLQPKSIEDLNAGLCPNAESFYAINLQLLGIPEGLCFLIAPHSAVLKSYNQTQAGQSNAVFRSLLDLWNGWPFETMETPNLPAIACFGLLLEQDCLSTTVAAGKSGQAICLVPGPVQIAPSLFERINDIWNEQGFDATRCKKIIADFKDFVGIPDNHEVAFYSSATQCMQALYDAIEATDQNINIIQVVNDAFAERLNSILGKTKRSFTKIYTPWTTSENSQLEDVVNKIVQALKPSSEANNLLFITPHKTATTADVLPDHLVNALRLRGLIMGRDYQMICDVTSGVGARNYATLLAPDTGKQRLPFTGLFAGMQKAIGLPAGIAFISLAPTLAKLLKVSNQESSFSLKQRLSAAAQGLVPYNLHLYLLEQKLQSEKEMGRTVAQIEVECRARMNLLLGWVERHPDLMCLVPNSQDRSPLLLGIFSQSKNLILAKRLMSEIFNVTLGSGYGPFEKESVRLYLANITYQQLKFVLAALDLVLELDDVVHTRGEKVPNIALREPHDPLAVISRVAQECSVDDLIKDQLGLDWVGRLVKTYNANVVAHSQKMLLGGKVPWSSVGHQEKSRIYGETNNLREMRKILGLKSEETKLDLLYHFQLLKETEIHLRNRILSNPRATWSDDSFSAAITDLLSRARRHLSQIEILLKKYVAAEGERPDLIASRDQFGRVEWPIVA